MFFWWLYGTVTDHLDHLIVFRSVTTLSEVYRKTGACATSSQWNRKMSWNPWSDWWKEGCLVWRREDEGSFSSESKGECWGRRTHSVSHREPISALPNHAQVHRHTHQPFSGDGSFSVGCSKRTFGGDTQGIQQSTGAWVIWVFILLLILRVCNLNDWELIARSM